MELRITTLSLAWTPSASGVTISISGLTSSAAQHNVELTAVESEGTPTAYEWQEDTIAISGATASTFTPVIGTNVSDAGQLRCKVTIGGDDYFSQSYEIRYAAGTAPAVANGQAWTVDVTSVSLDGSASGANLTFSYVIAGSTPGVTINSGSGLITGTPTSVDSGTITITATDQYPRILEDTFTFSSAAAGIGVMAVGSTFTVG